MNLFNFFFLICFYFINSEREFQLWEKYPKQSSVNIPDLENINSYIFDPFSRAELYLINNKKTLYFRNETSSIKIDNSLNLTDLQQPLINLNSNYYFCSSPLKHMISIKDNKLNSIPNPSEIENFYDNYSIKCFLAFHHIDDYIGTKDVIMIAYIGTPYLYFYYPKGETANYVFNHTFQDNGYARKIIEINNCINEPIYGEDEKHFIALIYGKNQTDVNNYFFFYFKKAEQIIMPMHNPKPFRNNSLKLYDIIEVSSRNLYNANDRLGYIFSYNPGTKDYIIYVVNLPNDVNIKDEFNGNYYFRLFKDVKINYAKFIDNTALLYYDIERLYDGKNYIGVADLEYLVLIYNIEDKPNSKLYFNFGNYYKNTQSEELLYFNGEYKVSYCPFIEEEDKCFFSYKYFDIQEINYNYFTNYYSSTCKKREMGPYCVSECSLGFGEFGQTCLLCNDYLFKKRYVSFNNKRCLDANKCITIKGENGICYDCTSNEIYYREDCLQSCEDVFSVRNENGGENCITCKDDINHDNKTYYSFLTESCVSRDECLEKAEEKNVNDDLYFCKECKYLNESLSLFKYKGFASECIDKCPDFFVNRTGSCHLCEDFKETPYYQKGICKSECDIEGFAFKNQELTKYNINITICENCSTLNWFIQENECISMCSTGYYIKDTNKRICDSCKDKFYVEKAETCTDKCPKGTRKGNNNTCIFCTKDEYYIEKGGEGECHDKCNQEVNTIETSFESFSYSYNECVNCNRSQILVNNKCIECNGYLYKEEICYKCFCGHENFTCYKNKSQCDCSNSPNYYGYSCQFYSEDDIKELEMIIVSMNGNKLIKTGPNYFTYSLKNNTKLTKDYYFEWKLYINNMEITGNEEFKEMFLTSNREAVFGIKKDIFENNNYQDFIISLNIYHNRKIKYKHEISLIIIESFEYENYLDRGENSDIELREIRNFELENKKDESKIYMGKYYFQYGLIDENNERIPLTNYIDSEKIGLNAICSKGYYINIKNDREEVRRNEITLLKCRSLNLKLSEILNSSVSSFKAEQILLLISNLRENNYDEIDDNSLIELFNFIKQSISIMIKSDGYWEDDNKNIDIKNITYSEPKLIFSLIYHLSNLIKKNVIKKSSINNFFDLYDIIFEEIFKYDPVSNKTLSESDIKSLFRTIDNLYDICIGKDLDFDNDKNSIQTQFIQTLDNLSKYLAYISYPSQTNEFRGKRISFFTYNLGLYEKSISFPYIYTKFETKLGDLSTYIVNDWYLNEQQKCDQKKTILFCLNKEDYSNLKNKILTNNNIASNSFISIYLLPEIKSANEKIDSENDEELIGDDEEIEKIPVNKNYSIIFKLFKNENENIVEVTDKTYVKAEFEFPFHLNADKNETESKKKYGLDKYGLNVTASPDNSDLFCHTNNMYNNSKYKFPCFTHFDYTQKIVRCSCNVTSGDEIAMLKDSSFAKDVIDEQFQKEHFSLSYKYILFIVYFFLFMLIIPAIFYLIHDIRKESKIIIGNKLSNIEDERKKSYISAKKYLGKGIFFFSFYLTLDKFPYFSVFNKNYNTYPKFIIHLVISIGLLIGFIMPIVPYLFISFSERDLFIGQRDINFMDTDIEKIPSDKYKLLSLAFSLFGIIFGNLFIYIFLKILNYYKDESDTWLKIKTICKDYIYYDIKSEVLLGAAWNKIKLRMISYYYICGKYILKNNKNINKSNNKFDQYLTHVSRNLEYKKTLTNNYDDLGRILPSINRDSNNLSFSGAINSVQTEKSFEMGNIEKDEKDEERDILLDKNDNYDLQKKRNEIQKKYMKKTNQKIRINLNLLISKTDNFKLDKNIKYDKSKRKIDRFEKVRNKYIYVNKKNDINEIEVDEPSFEYKNRLVISQQNNYFYIPFKSFISLNKGNGSSNASNNIIYKFILFSAILIAIFAVFIIITLYLVRKILNKFDKFILEAWIIPLIFVITIINFILYFFKMLIASILIFHYYNLRKKNCFVKFLFLLFVDKAMIQIYKIKNLITKYKKEFDYLQN